MTRPRNIKVATYYWGVDCPHCSHVSPIMKKANSVIQNGNIRWVCTDQMWRSEQLHKQRAEYELGPRLKRSFRHGGISGTPTIMWSDGIKTVGMLANDDTGEFAEEEMKEFVCRRAAKAYLNERIPDWELTYEEINEQIIDRYWDSLARRQTNQGPTYDPYLALQKITESYAGYNSV